MGQGLGSEGDIWERRRLMSYDLRSTIYEAFDYNQFIGSSI